MYYNLMIFNQKVINWLDLLWEFTLKELKIRYRFTSLGFGWMIIGPLVQMFVIGTLFSSFVQIANYYRFLFIGLVGWQFFSTSLSRVTTSFVQERSLLQKAKFPSYLIPTSIILANFIHLLTAIILLVLYLAGQHSVSFPEILLLFPGLLWLLSLTIGASLFTATLQVRYRDIIFLTGSWLQIGFYVTPILYNLKQIPTKFYPVFALNPLSSVFEILHMSISNNFFLSTGILLANLACSLLICLTGILKYRKWRLRLVDWL